MCKEPALVQGAMHGRVQRLHACWKTFEWPRAIGSLNPIKTVPRSQCVRQVSGLKEFGIGAQILKKLGIENINLLSTTKRKDYVGLSGFGLNIHQEIVL